MDELDEAIRKIKLYTNTVRTLGMEHKLRQLIVPARDHFIKK